MYSSLLTKSLPFLTSVSKSFSKRIFLYNFALRNQKLVFWVLFVLGPYESAKIINQTQRREDTEIMKTQRLSVSVFKTKIKKYD